MQETRLMMGMPITVALQGNHQRRVLSVVFDYFDAVDRRFSLYKSDSEISQRVGGSSPLPGDSPELVEVLNWAARTKSETGGYFEITRPDGVIDPSGIVKGWAVRNAAALLAQAGLTDYYVDAGGEIEAAGCNDDGEPWRVGIRNPFDGTQIVKAVAISNCGIATSGTYVRGQHIYDPFHRNKPISDIVSLTVIGPDVLEADRFATAAFAMGRQGIYFIQQQPGLEGFVIAADGVGTQTTGFHRFEVK
jgi:FAD:protein FMN transferase